MYVRVYLQMKYLECMLLRVGICCINCFKSVGGGGFYLNIVSEHPEVVFFQKEVPPRVLQIVGRESLWFFLGLNITNG